MTKKIDVAIIGAGAIGSTIASFIYKSKYVNNFALVDVNLVHIKEVNNNGLTIIQANGKKNVFSIKIEKDLKCKYDLIILCVKSIATVAVCRKYKNYLKKDGYFLSFQNGINNQNIIDVIGEKNYLAG
jgi:2-dehydropantoate 2-reductase